jgi:microcystin-dependent protein
MNLAIRRAVPAAVVGVVFGALAVGGVGWASIPDHSGVVHGCYSTTGTAHALKVIDSSVTSKCPTGTKSLNWDQAPPGIGASTGGAAGGTTSANDCTVGQIKLYAGNTIPTGEAPANGQLINIADNMTLFQLLGTTYGGNGTTNFALPNIESLAPNHMTYTICLFGVYP